MCLLTLRLQTIHDGVIDAVIDHAGSYLRSNEVVDLYSTNEPSTAFDQRIRFCLDLHNGSVKALRFPANSKNQLETPEERHEREREEKELAKELAEDEGDDEMF